MESIENKKELNNNLNDNDKDIIMYHKLVPIKNQSPLKLNNQILDRTHIKLLTYNLFLRPPLIKKKEDDYKNERLTLFYNHLKDYDIICIQELFETLNQRKHDLIRQATRNGFFFFIESPLTSVFDSFVVDAGILIFSRFPIKNWTFFPYPNGVDADGLSQKGFLYAQIEIKEAYIHLITTHLQSDDTHYNISNEIRLDQLKIINSFISNQLKKYYKKGDKIILTGGLNVDGNKYHFRRSIGNADKERYTIEYDKMIERLNSNGVSALDMLSPENGMKPCAFGLVDEETNQIESALSSKFLFTSRIGFDYIFDISYENVSSSLFCIDKSSLRIEKFFSNSNLPLTQLNDHYGLSCHIEYIINGLNGQSEVYNKHIEEEKQEEVPDEILPLINY